MYTCLYVCKYVCLYLSINLRMYVCIYVHKYDLSMYVCPNIMSKCIFLCVHAQVHASCSFWCTSIYISVDFRPFLNKPNDILVYLFWNRPNNMSVGLFKEMAKYVGDRKYNTPRLCTWASHTLSFCYQLHPRARGFIFLVAPRFCFDRASCVRFELSTLTKL